MANITMSDIANRLGVSRAAVSYALSGQARKRGVSQQLEQRILRLAQETGFRPSRLAQSLASRRTHTLGLVLPNMRVSYGALLTEGLETAAQGAGYQVLLAHHGGDLRRFTEILSTMREWHVDGLAVVPLLGEHQKAALAAIERLDVPTVLLERDIVDAGVHTVTGDVEAGIHLSMGKLYEAGHRRIALLNGAAELFESYKRRTAYEHFLRRHGLPSEPHLLLEPALADTPEESNRLIDRLLDLPKRPTAAVVNSGERAMALYEACASRHISIPRDLSVAVLTGMLFDSFSRMRFSSARMTYEETGRMTFELLRDQIEHGRTNPRRVLTAPVWVDGDSIAPPGSRS